MIVCTGAALNSVYAVGVRNGQLAESLSVLHRAALAAICHVPTRRRDRGERQT
jgi:hypothetical protein